MSEQRWLAKVTDVDHLDDFTAVVYLSGSDLPVDRGDVCSRVLCEGFADVQPGDTGSLMRHGDGGWLFKPERGMRDMLLPLQPHQRTAAQRAPVSREAVDAAVEAMAALGERVRSCERAQMAPREDDPETVESLRIMAGRLDVLEVKVEHPLISIEHRPAQEFTAEQARKMADSIADMIQRELPMKAAEPERPPVTAVLVETPERAGGTIPAGGKFWSRFRGLARITSGSLLGQECRVVITHPLCRPLPWMTGSLTAMNPGVEATMVLD